MGSSGSVSHYGIYTTGFPLRDLHYGIYTAGFTLRDAEFRTEPVKDLLGRLETARAEVSRLEAQCLGPPVHQMPVLAVAEAPWHGGMRGVFRVDT